MRVKDTFLFSVGILCAALTVMNWITGQEAWIVLFGTTAAFVCIVSSTEEGGSSKGEQRKEKRGDKE